MLPSESGPATPRAATTPACQQAGRGLENRGKNERSASLHGGELGYCSDVDRKT